MDVKEMTLLTFALLCLILPSSQMASARRHILHTLSWLAVAYTISVVFISGNSKLLPFVILLPLYFTSAGMLAGFGAIGYALILPIHVYEKVSPQLLWCTLVFLAVAAPFLEHGRLRSRNFSLLFLALILGFMIGRQDQTLGIISTVLILLVLIDLLPVEMLFLVVAAGITVADSAYVLPVLAGGLGYVLSLAPERSSRRARSTT